MIAAPSVPNRQASGTSRLGFSTAAEFCAADSMPRKAQSVSEILEPMPSAIERPCGFQASAKVAPLNQNQPMIEIMPTGMMTPQTVIDPMRPVILGPPKFATVVNHRRAMTPRQVIIGVEDRNGKKLDKYPRAEIAMATFPIASE